MKKDINELREEFEKAPLNALLKTNTVAAYIGKSISWFNIKAVYGGGIIYTKLGNHRLYRKLDVINWLNANGQRVRSTSEYKEVA